MMLDGSAIRALNAWCGPRHLSWSAAQPADRPAGGGAVMMLRPRHAARPWHRIMLVLADGELRLENELGEMLASASDLPALLDAVDGGVGEAPSAPALRFAGLQPTGSLALVL